MRFIFVKIASELQEFLGRHGIQVERITTIENSRFRSWQLDSIQIWSKSTAPTELKRFIISNIHSSNAQPKQDLTAIFLNFKHKANSERRFYVEFRAYDGMENLNSLQGEKLGWDGILAEPARDNRNALISNSNAWLDFKTVAESSGNYLKFVEVGILPPLEKFSRKDAYTIVR